jgi:hypothetical protein
MSAATARLVISAVVPLLLLGVLAACAPSTTPLPLPGDSASAAAGPTPTPSPTAPLRMDEANARMVTSIGLIRNAAGGTWTYGDQNIYDCTTADGQPGGKFEELDSSSTSDRSKALAAIGQLWDALGYTSTIVDASDAITDRKTTTPDGQELTFSVSMGAAVDGTYQMQVEGISTCALSSAAG